MMAKRDGIPKTDPSEIEALIQRFKRSNLEPRDTQLVERLLRLVLSMASLLQHKNTSIKRLKRLIFGPSSDKRAVTGSSTKVACRFFRTEVRDDRLTSSFFNLLGSSFKTRPTSEGG